MDEPDEGIILTHAYDGTTATYAYDALRPMPKIDDRGLPVENQDPPKPPKPFDSDEPTIIDRKNDR